MDLPQLVRISNVADRWDSNNKRGIAGCVDRLTEEAWELHAAAVQYVLSRDDMGLCDELGDVMSNVLRLFNAMSDEQKELTLRLAEMKVEQRTKPGGVKDKEVEAVLALQIRRQVGL